MNTTLRTEYERILATIDYSKFDHKNDKYSGVFLPIAFDSYKDAKIKIMVIGRETAGWNTNNKKNTIKRIVDGQFDIVAEGVERYQKHLLEDKNGETIVKSKSRFKQFYFKIAKELKIDPSAMIYANYFAWDYNRKSPMLRPVEEFEEIKRLSLNLLAAQIKVFKPHYIIFVSGIKKTLDNGIKELFSTLGGYTTIKSELIKHKFWEFDAAEAKCFRIAHPRATHGHGKYRELVLNKLKQKIII